MKIKMQFPHGYQNIIKMRLADFVIKFLEEKKIDTVFTVSGGGSIFLCDALYKSKKLKYIACHHEQAVSYAAESYSRAKNKPGAAIVTTGPGGTNCASGVACCWIDSVSTIFISGQVFLNQTIGNSGLRQVGVQEFDIVNMVKSSTKYAVTIKNPNEIKTINDQTKKEYGPFEKKEEAENLARSLIQKNIDDFSVNFFNFLKKF